MIYKNSLLAYNLKIQEISHKSPLEAKIVFRPDPVVWAVTDRPQRKSFDFDYSELAKPKTWKSSFGGGDQYSLISNQRSDSFARVQFSRPKKKDNGVYAAKLLTDKPGELKDIAKSRNISVFTSPIDDDASSGRTSQVFQDESKHGDLGLDFMARFDETVKLTVDQRGALQLSGAEPMQFLYYAPSAHPSLDTLTGAYDFGGFSSDAGWNSLFGSEPPNALLTSSSLVDKKGRQHAFEFTLNQPSIDPVTGKWTAEVTPLGLSAKKLSHLVDEVVRGNASFDDVLMFIDTATDGGSSISGEIDYESLLALGKDLLSKLTDPSSDLDNVICGGATAAAAVVGAVVGYLEGSITGATVGLVGGAFLGIAAGAVIGNIASASGIPEIVGGVGGALAGAALGTQSGQLIGMSADALISGAMTLAVCGVVESVAQGKSPQEGFETLLGDTSQLISTFGSFGNLIEQEVIGVADTLTHVINDIKSWFWS